MKKQALHTQSRTLFTILPAARKEVPVETKLLSGSDVAGLPVRDEELTAPETLNRRTLLELMAASSVLALGTGCDRKPPRKVVSIKDAPEYQHPGTPLHYATTWTEGQVPYGMIVKTLEGRPVKIEGLPEHPLNGGASSAAMQGALLSLYDPERLRGPRRGDQACSWEEADAQIVAALRSAKKAVLLTRSSPGPAEQALLARFRQACPAIRHFVHETVHDGARRRAWSKVYGTAGELRPRLSRAEVVVSIDCDFLGTDGDTLGAIADFAEGRAIHRKGATHRKGTGGGLSRLYAVESALTVTGSNADHRVPLRPSGMLRIVQALRSAMTGSYQALEGAARELHLDSKVLVAMASDLRDAGRNSLLLAGAHLPESVHAAVALLNDALGATGNTLVWNPKPANLPVDDPQVIEGALGEDVDVLICLGVNPAYDWPGGNGASLFEGIGLTVGHGLRFDETLGRCGLALPSAHNLESWNDASPGAGVNSLCQPVIAKLFDSRQEAASLLAWTKALAPEDAELAAFEDWHDFLQGRWQREVLAGDGSAWDAALRRGVVGEFTEAMPPTLKAGVAEQLIAEQGEEHGSFELVLLPHHSVLDGRFATNAWLQELPDPITKLVWDNAAMIAPETAGELDVEDGDWLTLRVGGRTAVLPVLIQPGVAPHVVATTLGHGREGAGTVGNGVGRSAAALLGKIGAGTDRACFDLSVERASGAVLNGLPSAPYLLARTQKAFSQHGRPIVLQGTKTEFEENPEFVKTRAHQPELVQLHDEYDYSKGHKWAMAIDLARCVGCSACVTACQAENNVPVVGKEECANGREMHWMRIDTYHDGDPANPDVSHQPMLCQHCDNAPCENVCPVNATAHSPEGLNEQVYNRCIGTRYCANNCPYKVRRFNFLNYTKQQITDPVQELGQNPQVSVRMRGVMEKCTFCVQRINEVKFEAKNQGEEIPDGAVRPACAQACPAKAIAFGDVNDPDSEIAAAKDSPLAYSVLGELNVRPNVHYLARVTNPNPEVPASDSGANGGGH